MSKKYTTDFFYGFDDNNKPDVFEITEEDISNIKLLKSFRSDESGYYDKMLQWRLSDNKHIKDGNDLSRLFVCMQLISMTGVIEEDNKLEEYHKLLLRRLYLEYGDYDDPCITMEFKRPFGNSHVMGDVREEIDNVYKMTTVQYESDDYTREEEVLNEFIDFLEGFFKGGFELKCRYFNYINSRESKDRKNIYDKIKVEWSYLEGRPHSYLLDWHFNKSEVRNTKIEEILK
jgi:hypothetical protein